MCSIIMLVCAAGYKYDLRAYVYHCSHISTTICCLTITALCITPIYCLLLFAFFPSPYFGFIFPFFHWVRDAPSFHSEHTNPQTADRCNIQTRLAGYCLTMQSLPSTHSHTQTRVSSQQSACFLLPFGVNGSHGHRKQSNGRELLKMYQNIAQNKSYSQAVAMTDL